MTPIEPEKTTIEPLPPLNQDSLDVVEFVNTVKEEVMDARSNKMIIRPKTSTATSRTRPIADSYDMFYKDIRNVISSFANYDNTAAGEGEESDESARPVTVTAKARLTASSGSLLKLNSMQLNKIENKNFKIFKIDYKSLQKVNESLLSQRNNTARQYSPEHIDKLKKSDPIFAKRHKQYLSARTTNKAPLFDISDHMLPMTLSKSTISRQRNSLMQRPKQEKPEEVKTEIQEIDLKVKKYIQNLSLSTLC